MVQEIAVDPLLTCDEVAAWLRKPVWTVQRMAAESRLPAIKIGRSWRFDRRRIEQWLAERSSGNGGDETD
jgi:excisionase family DNA binding protein